MVRSYSSSAVDAAASFGEILRVSMKSIMKEAMIEALEEVDNRPVQSSEDEESSGRSLPIMLLTTLVVIGGTVLWLRRRSSEGSDVLDQVSKRTPTGQTESDEEEAEADEHEEDQQVDVEATADD